MMAASVYAAIAAITREFAGEGIAKAHLNSVDQYQYRSIDDVMARLGPLLATHRMCVLPSVVERTLDERHGLGEGLLMHVALRVAYTLVSAEDGSSHVVECYGEALDSGDKATAKALSSAFKSAMLQAFCIPVTGSEDVDASTHKLARARHLPEPPEGWPAWVAGIIDMIGVCETREAMSLVQNRYRELLLAVSRERPDLYASVGQSFAERGTWMDEQRAPAQLKRRTRSAPPQQTRKQEKEPQLA